MKIGIVSESYFPSVGGIAEHIHHLATSLRQRGHVVKIITTSYGEYADAPFNGPEVIRVGKVLNFHKNGSQSHLAYGRRLSAQLRKIFLEEKFDVIHIHGPEQPTLPILAAINSPTTTVGTFHATYDHSFPLGILRPIAASSLGRMQARIVVSPSAQASIARYFPEGEFKNVPNGVDVERFATAEPLAEYVDRPTILFLGNFVIRKGFVNLLEAFPNIQRAVPKVRLLAVGDGVLRKRYEAELGDAVGRDIIFTGRVSRKLLPRFFASSTVYCSPATGRESFGIVLLEAMAAGKPIVASDISGYRYVLGRTKAGLLVPPNHVRALADSLIKVLLNPGLQQSMGAAGREVAKEFDWSRVAQQVESVYQEARAQYPATVRVVPGWRWLTRAIRSVRRAATVRAND